MKKAFVFLIFAASCMPGGCQQKIAEKVGEKITEKTMESIIKQQSGGKVKKMDIGSVKLPADKKDLAPPGFEAGMYGETNEGIAIVGKINMSPDEVEKYYVKKFGKPTGKLSLDNETTTMSWDNIGLSVIIKGSGKVSEIWITKEAK